VIPSVEQTPLVASGVNITTPKEFDELFQGNDAPIGGLVQLGQSETLSVLLASSRGEELSRANVVVHKFGNWEGSLPIPIAVSGSAEVVAQIVDGDGNVRAVDTQKVIVIVNPELTDRYLTLYRPNVGDTVVAGYNMFFDGHAQSAVNNVVTISLWEDECQVRVARQSFVLKGSGYWQGFLIIPRNVSGSACATAHFGEPGTELWREAQIALTVLPPGDSEARGVTIGNPPPESEVAPGSTLLIYGTSYNNPDGDVLVSIWTEDARILTEGVTTVDSFGYWELSLFIPAETSGVAEVSASFGESGDDTYVEHRILIHIGSRE
jgi:hypothetical protein